MKSPSFVSKFAALFALSVGLGHTTRLAAVNLVANPGFETGTFSGWTTYAPTGNIQAVSPIGAHSGSYGAIVQDTFFLKQNLTTEVGETYQLDFWLRGEAFAGDGGNVLRNSVRVGWNNDSTPLLLLVNSFTPYTHYSFGNLVATSTSTSVEFILESSYYWGFDDVSVVQTSGAPSPIPDADATLSLIALAMAVLAGARRWMR